MIRWRFVLTRVLIVVVFLLVMRWTAGPIVQYLVTRSLETATGAKVDIASTEIGLFPPRLSINGLKVADPNKEMKNLFEAETMSFAINGNALLKRRYEVSSGRISGIQIGSQRADSGWLEVVPQEEVEESDGPSYLQQWCNTLSGDMQDKVENFGENLATVQEAKRIRDFWQSEYDNLRQRAKQLENDVRTLRTTVKSIDNPLRDIPALQESLRRAEEIRKELASVRQQLDVVPGRAKGDMQALDQARRNDQERVASYLPDGFAANPTSIGPELLGELIKDQLKMVREYLDSGREIAQVTVAGPKAARSRGETIQLGGPQGPSWRVASCEIDGLLRVKNEKYNLIGVLENITSDTANIDGPLHAQLRLDGPRIVRIDFQRFYDTDTPRDHLRIHWPELELPAQKLGKGSDASIVIDGGKLNLWVDIDTCGDTIEGRLVSRQSDTKLQFSTKPEIERIVVVQSLQKSLSEIHTVDVDATFKGTWRRMDLAVNTNLSTCISDSVQTALQEQVDATRLKLAQQVEKAYQKQTTELQDWLSKQQSGTRDLVAQTDRIIDDMNKKVVSEMESADAYLGKLRAGLGKVLK